MLPGGKSTQRISSGSPVTRWRRPAYHNSLYAPRIITAQHSTAQHSIKFKIVRSYGLHLLTKEDDLPRQAQDRHKEETLIGKQKVEEEEEEEEEERRSRGVFV
jgi:hypothetical protein